MATKFNSIMWQVSRLWLTPLKLVWIGVSGSRGNDVGGAWNPALSGGRGGSDGGDNFR